MPLSVLLLLHMLQLLVLNERVLCNTAAPKISCRDGDGREVDWFVALKKPNSLEYAYISSSSNNDWKHNVLLNNSGPVDATLMQAANTQSQLLLGYNDEHPKLEVESISYGHMKGVVMLNGKDGFWLIHSVPKYPYFPCKRPIYPSSGVPYGQSFMCISINITQIENIGHQLLVTKPPIYHFDITQELLHQFPVWEQLRNKKRSNESWRVSEIQSAAGVKMKHFAKSPYWIRDIYDSIVAEHLHSSLMVETYEHGRELLDSNCSLKYPVLRIATVSSRIFGEEYRSTLDHSKWCVSADASSTRSVCIGDMNRAKTQFRRGGGLMCLSNPKLHELFTAAVDSFHSCNSDTQPVNDDVLPLLVLWLMLILLLISITTAASVAVVIFGCCRLCSRGGYQQI